MKTLHQTSRLAGALIAVAGIFSILPQGAQAATPAEARSIVVSYGQLDLGNPAAVDTLYRQLAIAAERACGAYEARNLRERNDWRACRDSAFNEGIARLVEARIAAVRDSSPVTVSFVARR